MHGKVCKICSNCRNGIFRHRKVEDFDLETVLREFLTFTRSKITQKG